LKQQRDTFGKDRCSYAAELFGGRGASELHFCCCWHLQLIGCFSVCFAKGCDTIETICNPYDDLMLKVVDEKVQEYYQ
jgi:hypothetical protein